MQVQTGNRHPLFFPPELIPDQPQQQIIREFESLYQTLVDAPARNGVIQRLFKRKTAVTGIYLWGGVGRGKTCLMDSFFTAIPFAEKQRVHFHRFMQEIHNELKTLPKSPAPLPIIARRLAGKIRLLCLDEFHVQDIGDAMLLAGFFKTLFENGVTVVTTANIPIDELYKNGLQRERFLPAIALLKQHTTELYLNSETDYRAELLERTGMYHLCGSNDCAEHLQQQFSVCASGEINTATKLNINHRDIDTVKTSHTTIWFNFKAICETPRSAADYLEIARSYQTVIISDVPQLGEAQDDVAQRFIHLIDALYDHRVKTIISAATRPEDLYTGQRHGFAFQRVVSRLREMGSDTYLTKAHRN